MSFSLLTVLATLASHLAIALLCAVALVGAAHVLSAR
jgi:hypothetical protein